MFHIIALVAALAFVPFTANADSAYATSGNNSYAGMSGWAGYGGSLTGGVYSSSGTEVGHSYSIDLLPSPIGVAHDGYTGSGGSAGGFIGTSGYASGSMGAYSTSWSSGWVYLP